MKEKIKQHIWKIELLFKISYLLLVLATFNTFFYTSSIQPMMVKITLIIGGGVLLYRFFLYKQYQNMPALVLMILFCVSFCVTTVVNRDYGGIMGNGKWIIWTGFQFFLLYVSDVERDKIKWKQEFHILSNVMVLYSSIAAIISIGHLVTQSKYLIKTIDEELVVAGFQWGRLWGVYIDPNYGAVFSVICIVLSLFFLGGQGRWKRIIYAMAICVNMIYIIFSDSRTGEVALVCCMGFLLLGCFLAQYGKKKKKIVIVQAIVVILLCAIAIPVSIVGVKGFYNKQLTPILSEIFPAKQETKSHKQSATVGRKKQLENNISNGRIAIWKSTLEIWETTPVVGTGYSTALAYAKQHCPDTYMVQRGYTSTHNTFFNILLYQGLVGAGLFLFIMIKIFFYYLKALTKEEEGERRLMWTLIACIGAVAIGMCFLAEGIYTNSMGAFVLWTFSGYIVCEGYEKKGQVS